MILNTPGYEVVMVTRGAMFDRRKLLTTIGTGMAVGLAGCTGGDTASGGATYTSDPEAIFGNPVRATPTDESEWVDPDVLNFAYVPTEDPQALEDAFQPIIDRLADATGKEIEYFGGQTYASLVEAMRSGRLHVGGFGAAATVFAVNLAGAQPFCASADLEDESIGYFSMTITPTGSGITEPEDLIGETVGHADPGSTSGNLLPRAAWTRQLGIEPDADYTVEYTGGHAQSVLAVHNGDLIAAHVSSGSGRRSMLEYGIEEEGIGVNYGSEENIENFDIIWKSQEIPSSAFATWYRLHPDLQTTIRETMIDYEFEGVMREYFGPNFYKEVDYVADYQLPRDILAFEGVEFTEDALADL